MICLLIVIWYILVYWLWLKICIYQQLLEACKFSRKTFASFVNSVRLSWVFKKRFWIILWISSENDFSLFFLSSSLFPSSLLSTSQTSSSLLTAVLSAGLRLENGFWLTSICRSCTKKSGGYDFVLTSDFQFEIFYYFQCEVAWF